MLFSDPNNSVARKRMMLKSKIHRATVTEANLDYEGSITLDNQLKVGRLFGALVLASHCKRLIADVIPERLPLRLTLPDVGPLKQRHHVSTFSVEEIKQR